MFRKLDVLESIRESGNVLIVRLDTAEEAYEVAAAAVAGGIRALEITLSIPGALQVIQRLTERFDGDDVVFGAGTVLDGHEAGGVPYTKALLAPLAHIPLLPAGGVTTSNVGDWFDAGVVAVGVGSAITKAGRPDGDLKKVTAAAEEFMAAIARAKR